MRVRAPTPYTTPDEVVVFFEDKRVCTAFAQNSDRGLAVTREEIASALQLQRSDILEYIETASAVRESARAELLTEQGTVSQEVGKPQVTEHVRRKNKPTLDEPEQDFFDQIGDD